MDTEKYDANGNGNRRRTLKMDTGETGGRSLTTDYGLTPEGYPVMPPAPHYDRGGEA